MKVEDLLEELVGLTEDAKEMPFVNKSFIEKNQILDIVDEIKANLPHEVRQAKAIVADRTKILDEAKAEAETVVRVAEERRKALLDESEITRQAQEQAEKIISEAKSQAKSIKNAANQYVDNIMEKAQSTLEENLNELQKTRQSLSTVQKKQAQIEE